MDGKRLRVLLAEGGGSEAAQGLRELYPESAGGLELTIVSTINSLLPTLKVINPEVLLVDLALLQSEPLEGVRHLHRTAPEVPLIIIAAADDKERAVECLHEGAMDYMLKGFMDEKTLSRVLRNALELNTLAGLTDLLRDPLTELYIRDGFLTLGAREIAAARQGGGTMVLLCALYDNFEATRAEFGPTAAERSLCEAARILSGCFRRTDLVARMGDGQFAGLAVNLAESSAYVLRQRIEKRFAMLNQEQGPWGQVEMRISMGVWNAEDSKTFPEFLDAVEVGLRDPSQALKAVSAIRGAEVQG